MMVLPSTTTVATTKTPEPTPDARSNELTKVWRINRNETCPLNDTKQVCEMYNQCMANKLSQGADQEPSQQNEVDLKMSQHSLMEFVKVNFAFYAGLAIGTVFGMLIVCLMSAVVSTYFTPSKNSANESGERARRNRRKKMQKYVSLQKFQSRGIRFNISQEIAVQSFAPNHIVRRTKDAVNQFHCWSDVKLFVRDAQRIHFSPYFTSVQCATATSIN